MPARTNTGSGKSGPRLHGEMLATSLLAFLKSCDAYGYQLGQQLNDSGLPQFDSGTIYRTLRQLEKSGFVSSFWDTSESGPARRMYSLTQAGDMFLATWIETLEHYRSFLQQALVGFGEPDRGGPAPEDGPVAGDNENEE